METIVFEPYGNGKFENNVDEWVYNEIPGGSEDEVYNEISGDYAGLIHVPEGVTVQDPNGDWSFVWAVLFDNAQGMVSVEYFDSQDEAHAHWDMVSQELDQQNIEPGTSVVDTQTDDVKSSKEQEDRDQLISFMMDDPHLSIEIMVAEMSYDEVKAHLDIFLDVIEDAVY